MDSPTAVRSPATATTTGSGSGSNDDGRRVKFLCSFLGSIMPRPQDGKLRYVGGETRIVSVSRDISFEELMGKMRELYEGVAVLKYQQPDEDLDALVSVVNDDDVVNMMEEYDKLGSGDGFTRLRIFLFSQSEQDGSAHFIDGDDPERRYVDALNSLNDASELRRLQQMEFPMIGTIEDIHVADPFINPIAVENGIHSQRSGELGMSQYSLHHIPIPHQQPMGQRYNEIDAQWNPGYYSPRHHGQCHHDSRSSLVDYPSSPSGTRYRVPFPEMPDKGIDRVPDEYARHHVNHHSLYDNQPQYPENVVWLPTGAAHGDKSGFPGNLIHGSHALDGNNICEHCRMGFQRAQPHLEHTNMLPPVAIPCPECPSSRDALAVNADGKLQPTLYPNDTQNHERGCGLQHQGSGRVSDHYVGDVPIINFPHVHGSIIDGHVLPSNHVHQQVGPELGVELFPDQTMAAIPRLKIPPLEECSVQYGKTSSPYGADNNYAVPCGHAPGYTLWRNGPTPVHIGSPHEATTPHQPVDGVINTGIIRGEGSPGFFVGPDSQSLWVDSSQKFSGHDGSAISEYPYANAPKLNPMTNGQENQHPIILDAIHPPQEVNTGTCLEPVQLQKTSLNMVHNNEVLKIDTHLTEVISLQSISLLGEGKETKNKDNVENSNVQNLSNAVVASAECKNSFLKPASECGHVEKLVDKDFTAHEDSKHLADQFNILPELIASVKKAALECHDEVKPTCEERVNCQIDNSNTKEETANEVEPVNANGGLELDTENDRVDTSKIEPTKAEAEAIARGLQTIRNDDLEEIRELGSGTYGAVYHGKWKGSDVAIKRIKASCFSGRPSERARLIADFWKEALMLSSLHHPNVVSFYGIVRDGPDGSLATVTEFMVNGSLKQFLHKKDRTIDRRKRLIIAMDAAFGMEYLHGKNIVHFDLKCENLLVNMRDPQRPVCKIGDLGLSKVKQHTLVSGGVRGTLPWMAPELLSGKSNMVSEKIDVYSFGIVMWELLTGDEPYADMHCASIIGGIVNNTLRPQIPTWCDPEWKSLMESCWASDPTERPSFAEISKKLRTAWREYQYVTHCE
ncbi:kinase superfamily with octicosapeptide/Phox/Bem1p domain-containing protein [Trifolium repens]|nr:kinase superfamily with octicosapeptide/Phox/Bem1p domain-containing protein [Trifolium repens]